MYPGPDDPLRIAYLSYRGKPHVGGQGVYTRHLTKALVDLGHHVEVLGGQPYPVLDERVPLTKLPSLDIFNDHYPDAASRPLGAPAPGRLWSRSLQFSTGTFPEPLAFSVRAWQDLKRRPQRLRPRPRQPVPRLRPAGHRAAACRPSSRSTTPSPSTGASRWSTPRPGASGSASAAGTPSSRCRPGSPGSMPRIVVVSENSIKDIHDDMGVDTGAHAPRARGRRPRPVPAPARRSPACPAASSPPRRPTSP